MNKGILYIATGEKCYAECLKSAYSVRLHNPDLPLAIFTDLNEVDKIFSHHRIIKDPRYSTFDKVNKIWRTPFEQTLYLDSDTFVTDSLEDLFEVLEYCDFAGSVAGGFHNHENYAEVPNALWELNGGVLLFNKTEEVINTLKRWKTEHLKINDRLREKDYNEWWTSRDQPSLRNLIWANKNIRVGVFPEEFNFLRQFGSHSWGKVIIAHGRGDIERIATDINKRLGNRIFVQGAGTIHDFYSVSFLCALKQLGLILISLMYVHLKRIQKQFRFSRQ